MKILLLIGLTLGITGGVCAYIGIKDDKQQVVVNKKSAEELAKVREINACVDKFNKFSSEEDAKFVLDKASTLPKQLQDALIPAAKLKLTIVDFLVAEELLDRARALQASLASPPEPSPPGITTPPKPSPPHPLAMQMFQKAVPLYENSKKTIDTLYENKDEKYNFLLNYTKGEVYHRYLQLFGTEETAKELLAQTVVFYKKALNYKPNDMNTVINIELLINDAAGMNGMGPQQQRNKLLNQMPGSGRSKGF